MKNYLFSRILVASMCLYAGLLTIPVRGDCQTTITGRISVQQHDPAGWIILHGKDATAYLLTGALCEQLKMIALEKSAKNIVSLQGSLTGASTVTCERTNNTTFNDKGEKATATDVRCIRYYYFTVASIASVGESDEELPALRRDQAAESRPQPFASPSNLASEIIGEIYGTITGCDLRSVIKSIEIKNRDDNSPLKSLTVMITADTRIAKRIGKTDPESLLPQSLRPSQRVTVMYSRNELRTRALSITVTKE